jgi:hypothetical protein
MRNVPSKRREMIYCATDNNNREDMNPQLSHEGHVPTAIIVFWPFRKVPIFQVNSFLFEFPRTISILQVALHSSFSRQTHW